MMVAPVLPIDQVVEMLGVQPGLVQPFAVADPFHDGLPLTVSSDAATPRASDRSSSHGSSARTAASMLASLLGF